MRPVTKEQIVTDPRTYDLLKMVTFLPLIEYTTRHKIV